MVLKRNVIPVIKIGHDAKGIFLERPNRFLTLVDILGEDNDVTYPSEKVHLHDPGRLKELLKRGNIVLVKRAVAPKRKTMWDMVAAKYHRDWIFVHSGYHRKIAQWILNSENICPFKNIKNIVPEVRFGSSRMDFLIQRKNGTNVVLEVKGCTLAVKDIALFPDAPTERGRRHMRTLIKLIDEGYDTAIMLLIFRPRVKCFMPNKDTDPKFAELFTVAVEKGVQIYSYVFTYDVENGMIYYLGTVPVCK